MEKDGPKVSKQVTGIRTDFKNKTEIKPFWCFNFRRFISDKSFRQVWGCFGVEAFCQAIKIQNGCKGEIIWFSPTVLECVYLQDYLCLWQKVILIYIAIYQPGAICFYEKRDQRVFYFWSEHLSMRRKTYGRGDTYSRRRKVADILTFGSNRGLCWATEICAAPHWLWIRKAVCVLDDDECASEQVKNNRIISTKQNWSQKSDLWT